MSSCETKKRILIKPIPHFVRTVRGANTLMVLDGMVYNTFSMDDVRKNFNNGVETMDSICFGVIQQIGHSIKHAFSPGFITLFVTQFSLNPTEQN